MLRAQDFILLAVIFASLLAGILFPRPASVLQPLPLYLMMFLLFLSFLTIRLNDVWRILRRKGWMVLWLLALKLVILPVAVFWVFKTWWPAYALGALLLSGISTGVVAPFISGLVGGNGALVLVLVVVGSPLVPFTLPALVKILEGSSMAISFWAMMRLLAMVVLVPIALVEVLRRTLPALLSPLDRHRYPISLVAFALINLGVFSKYAAYFHQHPAVILQATLVAVLLGAVYVACGIGALWYAGLDDRIAGAVAFGNMNNVLIIVFAAQFFGPLEPTLAAMYMIPFFGLILPLRIYRRRQQAKR